MANKQGESPGVEGAGVGVKSGDPGVAVRLAELDAFRGAVILLMFVVNLSYDAAIPAWFGHAGWNGGKHGLWLADLVFPWFLFIVGVAIPFSMAGGRGRGVGTSARALGALRRGAVLYGLGVLIWVCKSAPDQLGKPGVAVSWETLKHWDILPLLGLGSVVGVWLWLLPERWRVWGAWWFAVAVQVGKWWVMPDMTGTAGQERGVWMAGRTDVEHSLRGLGWWGTLLTQGMPACATVALGLLAGEALRVSRDRGRLWQTGMMLMGAGVLLTSAGLVLSVGMPMSKDFFTPSYVLASAGTGSVLLGVMVVVRRGMGEVAKRGWGILMRVPEVMGKNAIALYVAAEVMWAVAWTRWRVVLPEGYSSGSAELWSAMKAWLKVGLGGTAGAWAAIAVYACAYAVMAVWLHRRKMYIKV